MILRIAARNLLQHGRRSALVGLAIALVTGLAVLLLGLAHGVQQNLYRASTTLLAGEVNVGGLFKPSLGRAAPLIVDAGPLVEQIRQALPSAEYVATRLVSDARISGPSESLLPVTTVIGLDVEAEPALSGALQLEAGTLSALSGPGTILLFRNQADRLGVTIGDRVTLSGRTLRGAHNALDVRVVAIAAGGGIAAAPRVFVPLEVLRRLHLYRQDAISAVQIHLAPGSTPETIEAAEVQARAALAASGAVLLERQVRSFGEMRAAVEQEPWTGQRLYVSSWDEEFEFVSESWGLMSVLITLVTALLLAIVSAGLMNMLYVSVRERTRELGTLRAIGMSRLRILAMFQTEGFLLGLAGALAGATSGWLAGQLMRGMKIGVPDAVQYVLGMGERLAFSLPLGTTIAVVACITIVSTLASLLPSFVASGVKPVTAIHHLG